MIDPLGLPCPSCSHNKSTVTETRARDNSVMRRRSCMQCGTRFYTFETRDADLELIAEARETIHKLQIAMGGMWALINTFNLKADPALLPGKAEPDVN